VPQPPARYTRGEVWFRGENMLDKKDEDLRQTRAQHIGVVFQDPMTGLNPVFTVEQQMVDAILNRQNALSATYFGRGSTGGVINQVSKTPRLDPSYNGDFTAGGNMYFAEMQNHVVRRVDAKTRIITTVAGTGSPGFGGDGGPAAQAQLRQPHSIAFDPQGRLMICDIGNLRIRRVNLQTGIIETWAGTGERKPTPDGSPIAGTPLNGPRAIALDPDGNLYLALREGNAIYRIDPRAGRIYHVAGTGETGHTGDGGPAKLARLAGPKGVAWAPDGSLYLADTESHTIRRIDVKSGIISTVAGAAERGDGPDGPATRCRLARPHGVFVSKDGKVYIADSESHRIRLLTF